ncbi:hypothetical protein PHJA_001288100 [Phtheirospermum japonicum]|uniref:Uncharacterized protein n=1 Tax=Phtheirospermum japonicum TaxID=374723 RepID=A0A830CB13_9LAMI|nr:hypothetical protein PHJA_001288100 [Phtheirospermum japonicum]
MGPNSNNSTLDAFFPPQPPKFYKVNHHHHHQDKLLTITHHNTLHREIHRKMGELIHRRPLYLSSCMSPSCVPVHEEYSRIQISGSGAVDKSHRSRRVRKLLRKIVSESRKVYRPAKPLTFQYDAVSYSQNFDEGCYRDDESAPCRQQDFRWRQRVVHKK